MLPMTPSSTSAVAETTLNTDAAGAQARSASSDGPRRGSAADCPTSASTRPSGIETTTAPPNGIWKARSRFSVALLQARIQRQLGAAAVGEIGDVALTGETDGVGADERRGGFGGCAARDVSAPAAGRKAVAARSPTTRPEVRDIMTPSYM